MTPAIETGLELAVPTVIAGLIIWWYLRRKRKRAAQ